MDQTEILLQEITDAFGPSGYEGGARDVMARYLKGYAKISYDKLGSLIGEKEGTSKSPRVVVAGHLDEIGFMVKEITSDGFIKFLPLGGWWGHVALGQRVWVLTSKGPVLGVVGSTPPHLLKEAERTKVMDIADMFIDVGTMTKYDITKKLDVRVGDAIIPDSKFAIMNHKQMYVAKAFDNRIACAIIIDVMKYFKKMAHPNTVFAVGSVQEEVGVRGARTAAHITDPDVAIIVDVNIAKDIPPDGSKKAEKLGAGPAIVVYDGGMIPNQRLRKMVMKIAEEKKIPYHLSYMERGTTDGAVIHVSRAGVPCVFIGLPTRYIHSHNSIIYRKDYDYMVKLVTALIKKLDKKTVDSLTEI